MRSPLHGSMPPFELPSDTVLFHDWRYVNPGGYRWQSRDGRAVPIWVLDSLPAMEYVHRDVPVGVQLRALPAQRSEPVLGAREAGVSYLNAVNCLHEDGLYRLWYDCTPPEHIGTEHMGERNLVGYAESDNGHDWRLPTLGLVEYRGTRANNLVFGAPFTLGHGYHGGCVFGDPSAPPDERYKAFHLGVFTPDDEAEYRRSRPEDTTAMPGSWRGARGLFGAVSPDGLRWTALREPLVMQPSDTHNVCCYDVRRRKYAAYVRSWYMGRRTIGYSETDDFRRFPVPEELIWPNATVAASDLWYANAKTMMPGTTDYHVMFPMRWSMLDDHFDIHLATSPDGIVWGFVPGGAIVRPGAAGSWDGGVVGPGLGLVSLPSDRMGILVVGTPIPHKHPRLPPFGTLGWAWWPRDRLVALQASQQGTFALYPLLTRRRSLHLNLATPPAGCVQVEVAGADGQPLPGRNMGDCDVISGDVLDKPVTWHGESDLGYPDGAPIVLRFCLRTAELYAAYLR